MKRWLHDHRHFVMILLLFGFVRTAVADWNPVPTGSMRPTILEGDVVFVNRLAYDVKLPLTDRILLPLGEPRRGDIVTFSSPKDGTRLIKRIAAVPGDTISMRGNRLTVDGVPIDYAPLGEAVERLDARHVALAERASEHFGADAHTVQWLRGAASRSSFGPLTIPPGQYLMLGDNRDDSEDSRYFGLVPRERLIGRAERILVSADIKDRWQLRLDRFGKRFDD